jgi:hypothetical protein
MPSRNMRRRPPSESTSKMCRSAKAARRLACTLKIRQEFGPGFRHDWSVGFDPKMCTPRVVLCCRRRRPSSESTSTDMSQRKRLPDVPARPHGQTGVGVRKLGVNIVCA